MKKIEAVIRVERLEEVRTALKKLGYPGLTVTRVEGHGKQKGLVEQFRGREYVVELLPKIKLEIVIGDDEVDKIVESIVKTAKTGHMGDGKIFVSSVEKVIRIRTGEKGENAL